MLGFKQAIINKASSGGRANSKAKGDGCACKHKLMKN